MTYIVDTINTKHTKDINTMVTPTKQTQIVHAVRTCDLCGTTYALPIPFAIWLELEMPGPRRLMQDMMPNETRSRREQIVNGYHPECWEAAFGGPGE